MLSYLHVFHAGNHADVLKHFVLSQVLEHVTQKDKPFVYIDTHAGAGVYHLHSERASKNREYETGIERLWSRSVSGLTPPLHAYLSIVRDLNPDGVLRYYPGSPWIARTFMREADRARLFELHSNEYSQLRDAFASSRRMHAEQRDGFAALNAVLPPAERRAVILVDPPYEINSDYQTTADSIRMAHRKFASGIYLVWYPVLNRKAVSWFEKKIIETGIRNILLVENCIRADNMDAGMTGSGMIVINPPWRLAETLRETLPFLHNTFALDAGSTRLQMLVPE